VVSFESALKGHGFGHAVSAAKINRGFSRQPLRIDADVARFSNGPTTKFLFPTLPAEAYGLLFSECTATGGIHVLAHGLDPVF
jgi:hypothetical protein